MKHLHKIICVLSVLLIAILILQFILSYANAVQDLQKYGALGSPRTLFSYLSEYYFLEHMILSLWILADWILYMINYRKRNSRAALLLSLSLVLHVILWFHANFAPIPEGPMYNHIVQSCHRYRVFINLTTWPSLCYWGLHWFHTHRS